jgi:hypothetical protein
MRFVFLEEGMGTTGSSGNDCMLHGHWSTKIKHARMADRVRAFLLLLRVIVFIFIITSRKRQIQSLEGTSNGTRMCFWNDAKEATTIHHPLLLLCVFLSYLPTQFASPLGYREIRYKYPGYVFVTYKSEQQVRYFYTELWYKNPASFYELFDYLEQATKKANFLDDLAFEVLDFERSNS